MNVTIRFPALLSDRIDGVDRVTVDGDTIAQVLGSLTSRHPGLSALVWHDEGVLSPVLVVFLNDEQVAPDALGTPVCDGDEIMLVPAIEGGGARAGEGCPPESAGRDYVATGSRQCLRTATAGRIDTIAPMRLRVS